MTRHRSANVTAALLLAFLLVVAVGALAYAIDYVRATNPPPREQREWCLYARQSNGTRLLDLAAGMQWSYLPAMRSIAHEYEKSAPRSIRPTVAMIVDEIDGMTGRPPRPTLNVGAARAVDEFILSYCSTKGI